MNVNNYEGFALFNRTSMIGVVLSKKFQLSPQMVTLTETLRNDDGKHSYLSRWFPDTPLLEREEEGVLYYSITIDIANDETMAKLENVNPSFPVYNIENWDKVTDRLRAMARAKAPASNVAAREVVRAGQFMPFRYGAQLLPAPQEIDELFQAMHTQLGPKAGLGIYAFDMNEGESEPAMFFIGTKRAKLKGWLNFAQWRDVTDDEGLKLFNTLQEPLARIGRIQMVG